MWRYGLLLVGVVACSTAIIMIKLSETNPLLLSASRLLIAAALLSPLFLRSLRRHSYTRGHLLRSLIPAVLLAIHFITWTMGARMTAAANATLIVTILPAFMPLVMWLLVKEVLTRWEMLGTVLCLIGVVFLSYEDLHASTETFWGDVICFLSMVFYAFYLGLGRKNNDFADLWLYVVPIYAMAGLLCYATAAVSGAPLLPANGREWLLLLALGAVPTVLGHSIVNYSMQTMRGQVVSVFNLTQFIYAALMAYLIFVEIPELNFYVAAVLVLLGAVVVIWDAPQVAREEDHAEA